MSNSLEILSGDTSSLPSVANLVARFGATSAGTVAAPGNGVYEFARGQDRLVPDSVGYGEAVEETAQALRLAGVACVLVKVVTDIVGVIGAVTEDPAGTGPSMTITGTPTITLERLAVKVSRAGALGVAQASIAFDGYSFVETHDIPAEPAGSVTGTIDLTGITLSTLNTLTVVATPDGGSNQTVTLTTPADLAGLLSQLNGGTTAMTWSLIGGRYLHCVTDTPGAAGSIQIQASSTGDDELGLDNVLHSGSASTITLVGTGLTLTFPTGTYVLDTVYYAAIVGPRFSVAAFENAAAALKSTGVEVGVIEVCQTPLDAAEARSFANSVTSLLSSWRSDDEPWYPKGVVRSPLGATGAAGILANDLAVRAAMLGHEDTIGATTMVHGDVYTQGTFVRGSHRRSLATPLSIRAAGASLSEDPGSGELPSLAECSMVSPDQTTRARNENTATTKMRSSGFTVGEGRANRPYIARGVTRAASSSKFKHFGVARMGLFAARIAWDAMLAKVNISRDLTPAGKLQATDRLELAAYYRRKLEEQLVKGPQRHASAVEATIPDAAVSGTTRYSLAWTVQHRAQIENWDAKLIVSGVLTVAADGTARQSLAA